MDQEQSVTLKSLLTEIIDDKVDSLRFYYLGNNYKTKIEHIGVERGIAVDQPLFLYLQVRVSSIHKITGRLAPVKK